MHGWYLKLLGNYRTFIFDEAVLLAAANQQQQQQRPASAQPSPRNAAAGSSRRALPDSSQDNTLKGSGLYFDHAGLVASHRWAVSGQSPAASHQRPVSGQPALGCTVLVHHGLAVLMQVCCR